MWQTGSLGPDSWEDGTPNRHDRTVRAGPRGSPRSYGMITCWQCEKPGHVRANGVYSLKWRLTDRYPRWGTLADPRPGRAAADQCKSSEFLQELRISGFPRFGVSPTCFRAK